MALPAADVDVLGNGRLVMRTLQPGSEEQPKPAKGDVAELEVMKMLLEGEEHPCPRERSFRLGDGDECDAFELVTVRMRPNEVCAIRSVPAAFGLMASLCKAMPAAEVTAVVRLSRVHRPPTVMECPILTRVAEAEKKKRRGNLLFGRDELQAAAYSFSLGVSYIAEACHKEAFAQRAAVRDSVARDEEVSDEAIHLCCSLYTNLALAQLKHPDIPGSAVDSCNAALDLQPRNVKATYLKAKALLAANDVSPDSYQEAIQLLEGVLAIAPQNESAKELLTTARERNMQTKADSGWTLPWSYILAVSVCLLALIPWFAAMVVDDDTLTAWIVGAPPQMISDDEGMRGDDVPFASMVHTSGRHA